MNSYGKIKIAQIVISLRLVRRAFYGAASLGAFGEITGDEKYLLWMKSFTEFTIFFEQRAPSVLRDSSFLSGKRLTANLFLGAWKWLGNWRFGVGDS